LLFQRLKELKRLVCAYLALAGRFPSMPRPSDVLGDPFPHLWLRWPLRAPERVVRTPAPSGGLSPQQMLTDPEPSAPHAMQHAFARNRSQTRNGARGRGLRDRHGVHTTRLRTDAGSVSPLPR